MSPLAGLTHGVAPGGDWNVLGECPQMGTCREIALGSRLILLLTQMDPHRPCALYRLQLPHLQSKEGRAGPLPQCFLLNVT